MAAIFGFCGDTGQAAERLGRMAEALAHRAVGQPQLLEADGAAMGARSSPHRHAAGPTPACAWQDEDLSVVIDGRLRDPGDSAGAATAEDGRDDDGGDARRLGERYRRQGAECFASLRGAFAAAIWDRRRRRLILARDHLGHKPMFHAQTDSGFHFASEARAFTDSGVMPFAVNMEALSHFLSLRFVPAPHSLVRGVAKLAPGHYLVHEDGRSTVHRYWQPSFAHKMTGGLDEVVDALEAKLRETIAAYLPGSGVAGAFLSGGLDSGLIVANMSGILGEPFGTFSLGVENDSDEVPMARLVAEKFGTRQHESYPRDDVVRMLPAMIWHLDEPSDMVVVSKYLISRMAAPHADTSLSGDGGDELFAGFMRYLGIRDAQYYGRVPAWLRNRVVGPLARAVGGRRGLYGLPGKVLWLTEVTAAGELPHRYAEAVEYLRFRRPDKKRLFTDEAWGEVAGVDSSELLIERVRESDAEDPIEKLLHTDFLTRLPEHLLMLDDRTGAAHGVDVLCPLADKELVEFATTIPADMKISGRQGKFIERKLAERVLPSEVVNFSKTGWSFPFADLCAGPLQPFLKSVFAESRMIEDGILRRDAVDRIVSEHGRRAVDHHIRIWMLLSLEIWYRMGRDGLNYEDLADWMERHLAAGQAG